MATNGDDDLNWLYRRPEEQSNDPEPTRVKPPVPPQDQPAPRRPAVPPAQPPARRPANLQPAPGGLGPGGGPGAPPPGPAKPAKPKRPARIVLRVILVLVVLALLFLVGTPIYAWNQISRVDAAPSGDRPADQPGTTFLLLGSDSRAGLSKKEQKELGTGSTKGQRTDTIMIMYVPVGGDPVLISVPRDSYVSIPKNGKNKINAAYAFGGPKLMVQTIEKNTGLRIDGFAEVGFDGFVNVINALGGIEMCLDKKIKDKDAHLNLKAGCQQLTGSEALGYVRMRKADPRGDLGRVERQREMLAAVAKKASSPASVLNPVRYWGLANAGAESLALGEETTFGQTAAFVLGMQKVATGGGLTLTVPISNPDAQTSAGSSVLWDDEKAAAMFGDIARGDTSDLKKYAEK